MGSFVLWRAALRKWSRFLSKLGLKNVFVLEGMSLRPPFLMNQTEFMEYLPQTCDVMLSCMLNGQVSKIPVYGRVYLTSYRLVFMPHFFSYADRNVKVRFRLFAQHTKTTDYSRS